MQKIDFIQNPLYEMNDIGIAKLFMDSFKDELIFCNDTADWYWWNGKFWTKDAKEGGKRYEMIKELAEYSNKKIQQSDISKEIKDALTSVFRKLNTKYYRDSVLKDAQSICPVSASIFDNNKYLFNCQNGTFDIERGIFRDFEKSDYLTEMSNVYYDKKAKCPRFKQFLEEVLETEDKINYLLKIAAYCLTADTSYECFFVLYGNKTRNGKSTFTSTLEYLLGSYAKILRDETITQKSFNVGGNNATPEIARLRNARLALVNEITPGMMLNISLIKSMTGGDTLLARHLYKEDFEYKPKFKLLINTNDLPKMSEDSIFKSRRIQLLCFNKVIDEDKQDVDLKDKLKNEISGIFNLILPYYNLLKKEGWQQPKETQETIEKYRYTSNNILIFEKECLFKAPDLYEKVSDIYQFYVKWAEENGYNTLSKKNFKDKMEQLGAVFTEKISKKNRQNCYENTYWMLGFSHFKPKNEQIELTPINDEPLPF